ncbi:hypothetical protein BGX29_004359 [Mortierella sp. GBA35]|nr:hypothetical protein BGX29_004359 [Mortierella sp. GBA35]
MKALNRTLLIALLGLLCLSSVFVQGQSTTGTSATGTAPGPATGTNSATGSGTPPSGTATGTATGTASGTATGTAPIPTASLPPRTPQDQLSYLTMLKPKVNKENPPLFPLGVDLEFSWDYDKNPLLPIANLTIEAFLPDNSILSIANAIPGNLKNYTWPAANQKNQTNPIKTGMYTLRIFDGNVGRNGILPLGGYLATFSTLKFGLYIPSNYVPGDQMHPPICAKCEFSAITNGAMKAMIPTATLAVVFLVSFALLL